MSNTSQKNYHPDFIDYQYFIKNHPVYSGLDSSGSWVAAKTSDRGEARLNWARQQLAIYRMIEGSGAWAKLMYQIHPTKQKPCQTCGLVMRLDYIYLNTNFIRAICKTFPLAANHLSTNTALDEAVYILRNHYSEADIIAFLTHMFALDHHYDLDHLIQQCEYACRIGGRKHLGPGAMSNFPDRFDGFHSYNRCCRSTEDTGRSAENLKSYTTDRRAYENWVDGNFYAANQLMGHPFFKDCSADHLGPISLGFVHDPLYIRPLPSAENSSKRDRLLKSDILRMMSIEAQTQISPASWYCRIIWEDIKHRIQDYSDQQLEQYQRIMKINFYLFMSLLNILKNDTPNGVDFLTVIISKKIIAYMGNQYEFSFEEANFGTIINQTPKPENSYRTTEENRIIRVHLEAIDDYQSKDNRKISTGFDSKEQAIIASIQSLIEAKDFDIANQHITCLFGLIQNRLLTPLR